MTPLATDTVDVYICYEDSDATRLLQLLEDEGITTLVRDWLSTSFPTTVGHTAEQVIAVSTSQRDRAYGLIKSAIDDEVVSPVGRFT